MDWWGNLLFSLQGTLSRSLRSYIRFGQCHAHGFSFSPKEKRLKQFRWIHAPAIFNVGKGAFQVFEKKRWLETKQKKKENSKFVVGAGKAQRDFIVQVTVERVML